MDKRFRKVRPTVRDGQRALRDHIAFVADAARQRYGPVIDMPALTRLLEDRELVRYPVCVQSGDDALCDGEMAHAQAVGRHPRDGFVLWVHPRFRDRPDAQVLIIAYQLVAVNYADLASHEEAEQFGATLLGLTEDDYYEAMCALADEPAPASTGTQN